MFIDNSTVRLSQIRKMSGPKETRQWILTNPPTDSTYLSGPNQTFTLHTNPLPALQKDQILVKAIYYSNDPAQRMWITKDQDPKRLYMPPVVPGDVMRARAIAEVVESTSEKFTKGQHCLVGMGWAEYSVENVHNNPRLQQFEEIEGLSITHFLGALGMTGTTAYYGLKEVVRTGPGDTVVVSGAAGATGSMVVQIAKKMIGCKRVIGMAGSDEKCKWVESLGADVCLNYKDKEFRERLNKETDGFVEVYFDNVGGEMLDLMLTRIKVGGRVAACGAIMDYNNSDREGLKNWFEIISNRIEVRGFIVTDFINKGGAAVALKAFTQAYKEGKIKLGPENETVVDTEFQDVPKTWVKLFEGANTGKLVTKLV